MIPISSPIFSTLNIASQGQNRGMRETPLQSPSGERRAPRGVGGIEPDPRGLEDLHLRPPRPPQRG